MGVLSGWMPGITILHHSMEYISVPTARWGVRTSLSRRISFYAHRHGLMERSPVSSLVSSRIRIAMICRAPNCHLSGHSGLRTECPGSSLALIRWAAH